MTRYDARCFPSPAWLLTRRLTGLVVKGYFERNSNQTLFAVGFGDSLTGSEEVQGALRNVIVVCNFAFTRRWMVAPSNPKIWIGSSRTSTRSEKHARLAIGSATSFPPGLRREQIFL